MKNKTVGNVAALALLLLTFFVAGSAVPERVRAQIGSQPTILVQSTNVVTDAGGNWSVTWNTGFASATPFITARAIVPSSNNPINCEVVSRTASTVAGWCRQGTPTLLNLSIVTSGLTLNPFQSIPATSTTVMVLGRDTTQ